ncbi:MAG: type II toxin-antitoxin system RelE/ParE family toxin [Spirochaetales bacterium]|nr:type II toxin-antitoxin system RelE/ParE family toxin [Spirochaetales bacterium]
MTRLSDIPEGFVRYEDEPWYGRGLRRMPVDNYCVLYTPNMKDETVEVFRILYGGRNIKTQLDENTTF